MNISLPSFGRKSVLGLDIGSSSVKAVELNIKSAEKGFDLKGLGVASMPPESIVQGAFLNSGAIVDTIREAVEVGQIESKEVVAAVSGLSVIVKKVSLPVMTRDELADQIQWEAEQYIPFDVNEVNLDFQILEGESAEELAARDPSREARQRSLGRGSSPGAARRARLAGDGLLRAAC